jgi:hypothetical protein
MYTYAMANRLSSPIAQRAVKSFTAAQMPLARMIGTQAGPSQPVAPSWAWRNLSPKTKRNVKVLVAAGVVIDTIVLMEYETISAWFSGKDSKAQQ